MRAMLCALAVALAIEPGAAQRIRFGPGVCGPIDPAYVMLAAETGGQVFPTGALEIATSVQAIDEFSLNELLSWASGTGETTYAIPIDPSVERVKFSVTFDAQGGTVTLASPDGSLTPRGARVEDTLLNCGRLVTIDAPANGTWHLRVSPTGRFWLRAQAKSRLSLLAAEFVQPAGDRERGPHGAEGGDRFVRIPGSPVAGRPARLRVRLSPEMRGAAVDLVSLDVRRLHRLDLTSAGDGELMGAVTLPDEPFRVRVSGVDESGVRYQRMWAGLFHGEQIEVVPMPGADEVDPGRSVPVTFTIRNHGPRARVALVGSDHRGRVIAVDPPALELDAGGEGTATVLLTVPADAAPGSEASARVTATADAAAPIGGSNSAATTFRVTRR